MRSFDDDALSAIANGMQAIADCFNSGGKVIYVGAGTSGRLGALDAAEMPPTFGVESERFIALIAGGALSRAKEGSEDDTESAIADFESLNPKPNDAVIGVSASGTTPYVVAIVKYADCKTIGIANNPSTPLLQHADIPILLDTGPEILTGSTRLKAGTAQKIALNMLSTGAMVLAGKVKGNLMSHMKPLNAKLRNRAIRIVSETLNIPANEAQSRLESNQWNIQGTLDE
jgi:N-acetylmuramic acid 6-phosphate etherase